MIVKKNRRGWLVTDRFGTSHLFKLKKDAIKAMDKDGTIEVQYVPSGKHWAIKIPWPFAEFLLAFTENTKRHSGTVWDARTWHYTELEELKKAVDEKYQQSLTTPVEVRF